jgi:acyl carrier protein
MTQEEIIKAVEEQSGVSPVTLETTLDSIGIKSLDFVELMMKCNVPRLKEIGIETVGDIVRASA